MPKLYTIGEVSELLNVPKSTIRFWDEQGLDFFAHLVILNYEKSWVMYQKLKYW